MSNLPPPPGFPPPSEPQLPPPPPGYTYGYGQGPPNVGSRAGFGARLGAWLLDGLIVFLFVVPAIVVIATGPTEIEACSVDRAGDVDPFGTTDNAFCEVPTGGTIALFILLLGIALIGGVLYHTLMVGRTGQTIGRRALGIRVVDANTGAPIGSGRAFGRFLFEGFISGSVCYLGYLWMLWDPNKQTWHDKVVNSIVVQA